VATGGTGTFGITLTVPAGFGSFSESFNLLAEKLTWFSGPNYVLNTRVNSSYSWSLSSQTAWTDSSKAQSVDLNNLSAGQSVYVEIKARNTGNTTWLNNGNFPVRLGTQQPRDHVSRYGSAWTLRDGGNNVGTRAAQLTESSVATGGTGTFGITLTVPAGFGSFSESFNLLAEKLTWFSGPNYVLNTRVN
jgi:hypothetical protein